ncbi:beta-lactamase domain-containing protein [Angomonas deanei]|nr:beta-lactamase domain-containing protein [Angomonas deanei]|eukprot:EPY42524.1 beta-lactamase domain-containing protein [Angomonas deanei]
MFDPIFADRASPFSWAGPARRFPPSASFDQLPNVDIITISHNHYDHMCEKSLRRLYKQFPRVIFVTPLRLGETLIRWGIPASNIKQMDWWEEMLIKDVVVGCAPAHHWCQHFAFDRNEQLWSGWVIGWRPDGSGIPPYTRSEKGNIEPHYTTSLMTSDFVEGVVPGEPTVDWDSLTTYYFTGDTAFNEPMFHLIRRRFTRIDMAALPIGAYAPRWYMYNAHIDPENEAKVFNIIQCKDAFAVHWATFELADEPLDEPQALLEAAKAAEGIPEEKFRCIPIGTYVSF